MILLEPFNRSVYELLKARFESANDPDSRTKIKATFADFDGITYNVISTPSTDKRSSDSSLTGISVSILIKYFNELKEHGVLEYLRKEYGDLLAENPVELQSVTLNIDLTKLPADLDQLAMKCALLKRNCLAALFVKFFDMQPTLKAGTSGQWAAIHNRPDETMYIRAVHDRVTIIFSTVFKDQDDLLIGKMFLQEFADSSRRMNRGPKVLFSYRTPPSDLNGTGAVANDSTCFITLVLQPSHVAVGSARQKSIDLVQSMRTYLHYHLKCSKAFIQMRMRAKTSNFLKVVNRASVQNSVKPVVDTAITGVDSCASGHAPMAATKLAATGLAAMSRAKFAG